MILTAFIRVLDINPIILFVDKPNIKMQKTGAEAGDHTKTAPRF
jgi:hypothetical protein